MKDGIKLAIETIQGFELWADSQADAQSKGGHATFDIMQLREQRDIARTALAALQALDPQAEQPHLQFTAYHTDDTQAGTL